MVKAIKNAQKATGFTSVTGGSHQVRVLTNTTR